MHQQHQQQRGYNNQQYSAQPPGGYMRKGAPPLPPPSSVMMERRDHRDPSLVSEVVPVPPDLLEWVSGSKVQAMFLKVKEASGIGYITSTIDANGASIMIHSPSEAAAKVARMLVEINFKEQIKYQKEMQRLHMMQENLFEVQGAVASGLRIEFVVPRDLVGIIIGKKGSRIQDVQRETGVDDINIDGDTGRITISGPSPGAVQRARELVDIVEEKIPLPQGRGELLSRDYSSLSDIRDMSKCIIARVPMNEDCIVLIGTRPAITSAKLILETQMEYMMKRAQLYESEQSIRQQLTTLKGPRQANGNNFRGNNNTGAGSQNKKRGNAPAAQQKETPPPPAPLPARQVNNNSRQQNAPSSTSGKGFSAAELQKKLSALAMSEEAPAQKSPPNAGQKGGQKSDGNKKEAKANQSAAPAPEDGVHTSKRSRNPAAAAATAAAASTAPSAESNTSKQKATRGAVSNKVTKPNGRGETLRAAVEAKQS